MNGRDGALRGAHLGLSGPLGSRGDGLVLEALHLLVGVLSLVRLGSDLQQLSRNLLAVEDVDGSVDRGRVSLHLQKLGAELLALDLVQLRHRLRAVGADRDAVSELLAGQLGHVALRRLGIGFGVDRGGLALAETLNLALGLALVDLGLDERGGLTSEPPQLGESLIDVLGIDHNLRCLSALAEARELVGEAYGFGRVLRVDHLDDGFLPGVGERRLQALPCSADPADYLGVALLRASGVELGLGCALVPLDGLLLDASQRLFGLGYFVEVFLILLGPRRVLGVLTSLLALRVDGLPQRRGLIRELCVDVIDLVAVLVERRCRLLARRLGVNGRLRKRQLGILGLL